MKKQYASVNILKKVAFILLATVISRTSVAQNPGCHAGFTFTILGNTVTFTDTSFFDVGPQNTSWLWDFGDGSTDTTQNPVHTFNFPPTHYTICLTVTNCAILPGTCCTDSACIEIQVGDPTGITSIGLSNKILIYPNPVSESFFVNFNLSETNTIVLHITDATGRICHLSEGMNFSKGNQTINLNGNILPSKGIYFMQIITDGKLASTSKLIKL